MMTRTSGHRSRRVLHSSNWTRAFASETSQQHKKLSDQYAQLLAQGQLKPDDRQRHVVESVLDRLHRRLRGYALPVFEPPAAKEGSTDSGQNIDATLEESEPSIKAVMVPRGLYLHGSVGTGKTMLLELLFEHAQVERKRRVHFNKFMLEVHQHLHHEKQDQLKRFSRQRHIDLDPSRDAITIVAERMAEDAHLLCFDEFQVTDIADALILRKLFGVFFARGVVVVATSNIRPQKLYENGTNREYFLPFVDQLERHTNVVDMDSAVDHRQLLQTRAQESFLFPLSPETSSRMDELFNELVHEAEKPQPVEYICVPVMMGRHLEITGTCDGICRVDFDHLCNTEKGAADYKALCECFHTIVLENVPVLEMKHHNQARRFILLIDELYEHHTRLVCSSQGPADQIFRFDEATVQMEEVDEGATLAQETQKHKQQKDAAEQGIPTTSSWDGPVGGYTPAKAAGLQIDNLCAMQDLKIAFHRAVSRLREMQSEKYLHEHTKWRSQRQTRLTQVLATHKD